MLQSIYVQTITVPVRALFCILTDVYVILPLLHWAKSLQFNGSLKVQTNIYSLCFHFKVNGYFKTHSLLCFPLLKWVHAF